MDRLMDRLIIHIPRSNLPLSVLHYSELTLERIELLPSQYSSKKLLPS